MIFKLSGQVSMTVYNFVGLKLFSLIASPVNFSIACISNFTIIFKFCFFSVCRHACVNNSGFC